MKPATASTRKSLRPPGLGQGPSCVPVLRHHNAVSASMEASAKFNIFYDLRRAVTRVITSVTLCWSIRVTWIEHGVRGHWAQILRRRGSLGALLEIGPYY